jgi:MoxR-like ATPase
MKTARALGLGDQSSFRVEEDQRQDDQNGNYHESPLPEGTRELGRIYVEARVQDGFTGDLIQVGCRSRSDILSFINSFIKIHTEIVRVFSLDVVQNLSLILWQEILESDACKFMHDNHFNVFSHQIFTVKGLFPEQLQSLKAVEYVGRELSPTYFPVKSIILEVHVYCMCSSLELLEDNGTLLQAEIVHLPSSRFEGIWEGLVFDTDIRGNLIRLMANMCKDHSISQYRQLTYPVKFSRALITANIRPRTNRLILLSGPPGTGKTTLCQALAQKLSIRLSQHYPSTSLIQINAATLLSKFFSESAKHILQIFTAILAHCTSSPRSFTIVLIDEIESLASSRTTASSRGEVQDTIRATNALLTGFDKVKSQPNLIILCTSNMIGTLDAAFLDRCGHRIVITEPSLAARYQILRNGIQELIAARIIKSDVVVPSYRDTQLELLSEPTKPGSVLVELCNTLDTSVVRSRWGFEGRGGSSARYLGQLPEVALADRLIVDSCSLDEALEHMKKFVFGQIQLELEQSENAKDDLASGLKRKRNEMEGTSEVRT